MLGFKVLGEVTFQVFLSWVPTHQVLFSFDLVRDPEKSHFHAVRALFFHSVFCNAHGGAVVDMDWGGGLWVSHLFQY